MARAVSEIIEERRKRAFRMRDERLARWEEQYPALRALRQEKKRWEARLLQAGFYERAQVRQEDGEYVAYTLEEIRGKLASLDEELQVLFREYDIQRQDLQPDFTCPICQDTGFVAGKSCQCRDRLLIEQNVEMSRMNKLLAKQNFSTFDLSVFRADRQDGEPVSPREHMKDLYQTFNEEYVKFFSAKTSPSLFLFGKTGVGKTFLCACIGKAILDRGFTVFYRTAPEMLDFLASYSFMYPAEREQAQWEHDFYYQCDLLIIDDLGTEHLNEKMRSCLFQIINQRMVESRPMIVSSNLEPAELEEFYDTRIASRLAKFREFELYGNDLRRR